MNSTLEKIRETSPLVHNITNYVVMNTTANALLAIGASPIMAHAKEEVEDMVNISSALVLNMGTLSSQWVEAMLLAGKTAQNTHTPVVFDPVGVGASKYRTAVAKEILETVRPQIIRGNASEIMALVNISHTTKGVDSTDSSDDAVSSAGQLSKLYGNTIVISGSTDYIITGDQVTSVTGGDPMMSRVTGMGCTATAIIGACVAVEQNCHTAAVHAMEIMAKAGEMAAEKSSGNGSFQVNFLDVLCQL